MKQLILLFYITSSTLAWGANPTSVIMTFYRMGVSTSGDCSNPNWVATSSTGVQVDMIAGPVIGQPIISSGTYPCIVFQISDNIKFRSDSTTGVCAAGTEYTIDICNAASGQNFTQLNADGTYGSNTACTGSSASPVENQPLLFLTTASTNTTGQTGSAFQKPTSSSSDSNGFFLNGALVLSAKGGSGQFYANFNGKIDGSGANCDVQPPIFGFR